MAVSTSAVPLDCSPFCVRASLKEGMDAAVSTFAVSLLSLFASLFLREVRKLLFQNVAVSTSAVSPRYSLFASVPLLREGVDAVELRR
jgi:hypothetical protein